jgi:hypothetical protein
MSARSRSGPWFRVPGERYEREWATMRELEDDASRNRGFRYGAWRQLAIQYVWRRRLHCEGEERFYAYLNAIRDAIRDAIQRETR